MSPARSVGSRLLSFADRLVSNWAGSSSPVPSFDTSQPRASNASQRVGTTAMQMARPWYETVAEVAARRPAPAPRFTPTVAAPESPTIEAPTEPMVAHRWWWRRCPSLMKWERRRVARPSSARRSWSRRHRLRRPPKLELYRRASGGGRAGGGRADYGERACGAGARTGGQCSGPDRRGERARGAAGSGGFDDHSADGGAARRSARRSSDCAGSRERRGFDAAGGGGASRSSGGADCFFSRGAPGGRGDSDSGRGDSDSGRGAGGRGARPRVASAARVASARRAGGGRGAAASRSGAHADRAVAVACPLGG